MDAGSTIDLNVDHAFVISHAICFEQQKRYGKTV
jgi:hypothetical protein